MKGKFFLADYKQYEREGGIINFNNIPNELQVTARFCAWKREPDKNGRITKVPYNPKTGGKAKSSNPDTFTDFETAVAACQPGQYDGIGIGIFDTVCAVDIDHCVADGVLSEMAQDIVNILNVYTEYSPSGEGVRILFAAKDFSYDKDVYYINKQKLGLEVYVAGATKKYVTVTGNAISAGEYGDRTSEWTDFSVVAVYIVINGIAHGQAQPTETTLLKKRLNTA